MPDDPTPSFLEIWLDPTNAGNDGCELVITTPEGETCVPMREGALRVLRANDDVVGTAFYARRVSTGNRALVLVALSPTASRGNVARPTAPAGDWNIAIRNLNASAPLTVDTWIQRDDTPWDFPRQGRQSHFSSAAHRKSEDKPSPGLPHRPRGDVKDDDVGNDSSIRCRGTLNSIGTGTRTLVIGAFRAARGRAAPYSSSGPTTTRPGPNAAALSDLSTARPGIIGAGSHSGSAVTINGTSVSAAAITRFVAERMRNFGWNGVDTLNAAAAASEATNAFYFPRAVDRVGEGRLLTAEINNGRQGKVTR
jgi:hypothetical protein